MAPPPCSASSGPTVGRAGSQEPEVDPEFGLDAGGLPEPAGGVPPDALPMLGQLWVDPEEFGPVLFDPELPLLGPDDGVVVDEFELVPVPPVAVEVVAAPATSAPPATRPVVSAPRANMLRRRSCMGGVPFHSWGAPARSGRQHTLRPGSEGRRTTTWVRARSHVTNR